MMEITAIAVNTFGFKVKAEGVDLTGTANPVDITLYARAETMLG